MSAPWPRLLALLALGAMPLAPSARAQALDDSVRVGDRILLRVAEQPQLSDSFTVGPGPALALPVVGEVSLAGVRRADIEPYLTTQLAHFLKEPVVSARVLVRLAVLGEVEHPGFYAVPADHVLTDAIMAAGGPTRDAKFSSVRVERNGRSLWSGTELQDAIARGLTVAQMHLGSGDRIVVPHRHDAAATAQVLGILLTVPAAIYGLTRLF